MSKRVSLNMTSSFLSPKVAELFQSLTIRASASPHYVDYLRFDFVLSVMPSKIGAEESDDYYKSALMEHAALFNECYHVVEQNRARIATCVTFNWLTEPRLFNEVIFTADAVTGIVLLTPLLERSLGDYLWSVEKVQKIPSLLRDLLRMPELEQRFGPELMQFARILLGSPKSLNLRNIVWHGFLPSSTDGCFGKVHLSALLILVVSMSYKIGGEEVLHRPAVTFDSVRKIHQRLCPPSQNVMSSLLHHSNSIKPFTATLQNALEFYSTGCYRNCLALLLIVWEASVRQLYVRVNDCPERMMTAESDEFYTTFETFMEEKFNSSTLNKLPAAIGNQHMELIFDLLILPEGPRIRDKLSHGEIVDCDKEKRNFELSCQVVSHSLLHILDGKMVLEYSSQYHPTTMLMEEVKEAMDKLSQFSADVRGEWNDSAAEFASLIGNPHPRVSTLFRPKRDYTQWSCMRKTVQQIKSGLLNCRQQWTSQKEALASGNMRSRQRLTHERMLQALPVIFLAYITILQKIYVQVSSDQLLGNVKPLNLLLQLCQNLSVNIAKNRWNESVEDVKASDLI